MITTDNQESTNTKLERIAWLSRQDKSKEFSNLMHHFNEESLRECFQELDRKKALGADRVSKDEYGQNLGTNLKKLVQRMKLMQYRPSAVRQVLIPKAGGKERPLGISNFEDKIVQKMMQKVLEAIYESTFLPCSYGFRKGMGCHDAVRDLYQHLYNNQVETVIDVDIENFFGSINHQELEQILRQKVKDQKLMRYIIRMFKAGTLRDGELTVSDEGVMQGSICSPILANIFAHLVIDEWFESTVKKYCRGKVKLFRYCDDLCIAFQYGGDAERVKIALGKRLNKFKLKLNEEKTRVVTFNRNSKGCFDFLGFTFYWGKSRKGRITPMVRTSKKRIRSKIQTIKEWIKGMKDKLKLTVIWENLKLKILGHLRYYGVSFNTRELAKYVHLVTYIMFKWLNRRSQKRSFDWEKFKTFTKANPLPAVKIYHKLF
jgi:RNA-directed DNA polymerase